MSGLVPLTDAEIDLVAGGHHHADALQPSLTKLINVIVSSVTQSGTASNSGAVSATANGSGGIATAIGALVLNISYIFNFNFAGVGGARGGRHH